MFTLSTDFFKVSFRRLWKERASTLTSIVGLTIGLMSCMVIVSYNSFEKSYDKYHPDSERIYRVVDDFRNTASQLKRAGVFYAVAGALRAELPDVEEVAAAIPTTAIIRIADNAFNEQNILVTTPEYFKMFDINFVNGNGAALKETNTVLLSKSTAAKFFPGVENPVGQVIEIETPTFGPRFVASVEGVFADIPSNSHLRANVFMSMKNLDQAVAAGYVFPGLTIENVAWRWIGFYTFVRPVAGTNIDDLSKKIENLVDRYRESLNKELNQDHRHYLQPLEDIHMTTGIANEPSPTVSPQYISIFYLVAALILLMAWINYINLSTARAINRAKEVGMRKVLGAGKKDLVIQFLSESLILHFAACTISLAVIFYASPFIENAVGKPIFSVWNGQFVWIGWLALATIVGAFASGLYPAFVLTAYEPLIVLKGKFKTSTKGVVLRKGLVAFQFVIASGLLCALIVIEAQLKHMMNADLGIDIEHKIIIDMPGLNDARYTSQVNSLKAELMKVSGVSAASVSSLVPGVSNAVRGTTQIANQQARGSIYSHVASVDWDFIDLFKIDLVAGRKFSEALQGNQVIVNKKAMEDFGYRTPQEILDENLLLPGGRQLKVVGVVENFHQIGLQFAHEPIVMVRDSTLRGSFMTVEFNGGANTLKEIEAKVRSTFNDFPYNFRFIDDVFQAQYQDDKRFEKVFVFFSIVAVFIASLGLVGLAAFIVSQKAKEVSIRKVLGASTVRIFVLLNQEYIILAGISFVVATPLVFYLLTRWLEVYAYRIDVALWMMVVPFVVILTIVILITGTQTLKTVLINPSKALAAE